jgi:hypothetical protein
MAEFAEMGTTEDQTQVLSMKVPEDLPSICNAESNGKKSHKSSTRKKKLLVCDEEGCNKTFRRPSELT